MSIVTIGIDNGLFGAVVAVNQDFNLVFYRDTPIANLTKTKRGGKKSIAHEFAPTAMKETLQSALDAANDWYFPKEPQIRIWLEVAHAMPQQGLSSTFKTGRGFGLWEGIVVGLGLPYDIVHAKTWTKEMLKDVPAGDPKDRSMIKAQRLFGSKLPLTKPGGRVLSLDGRADAALIACYGMTCMTFSELTKKSPVRKK